MKLLPCPFCGKPPRICPDDSYGAARVWCPDDNECWGQPEAWANLTAGETLDIAKERWNTRTPDPAIVKLRERVAVLEKQRLMLLAAVYREAPKFIATICDEDLDPSGALLGEVRTLADAALSPSQQDKRL